MTENNTNQNNDIFGTLGDGLRKVFLAGVGALASTAEKGQEIVNELVKKGELTVEQGKQLNSELAHNAKEGSASVRDTVKENVQNASQTMRDAAAGLRESARSHAEQARADEEQAAAEAQELKEEAEDAFQAEADKLKKHEDKH